MRSSHPIKKLLALLLVLTMLGGLLALVPLTTSAATAVGTAKGSQNDPIIVDNEEDLKNLLETLKTVYDQTANASIVTYYVELTNNIDFEGREMPDLDMEAYSVHFEGGNHVISNFTAEYGLFGAMGENSTVQNLAIEGATILAPGGGAGALLGTALDGFAAIHCSTDETTTVTNKGNGPTGGLVGQTREGRSNNNIYFVDCTNRATVSTAGGSIGGIIGQVSNTYSHLLIDTCENHGALNGGKHSGGLVGAAQSILQLRLNECMNTADVTTTVSGGYAGGLLGYATCYTASTETWTVKYSKNTGNVTAPSYAGGIIGYATGAPAYRVSYTVNTGAITASASSTGAVGGLIGYHAKSSYSRSVSFSDCYNEGKLTLSGSTSSSKKHYTGGIIGYFDTTGVSTVTVKNCYDFGDRNVSTSGTYAKNGIIAGYLSGGSTQNVTNCKGIQRTNATAMVGQGTVSATGSTTIASKQDIASTVETLDRNVMLRAPKGDGSKSNPYQIGTAMELQYFSSKISFDNVTYAELTDDIDFGGYSINIDFMDSREYVARTLHFDGNGYTLSNYTSKNGLFQRIGTGSTVTDLHVSNATIENPVGTNRHAGAIVGYVEDNFTMVNCSADESVTVTQHSTGGHTAGGLVGSIEGKGNSYALFADCTNHATVTGNKEVGGLLGKIFSSGSQIVFMNCENNGTLTSPASVGCVGGILGAAQKLDSVSFYNCVNNGTVGGEVNTYAGGMLGYVESRMTGVLLAQNCKNTGNVSAASYAGALVGRGEATKETAESDDKVWSIVGCTNSGSPASLVHSLSNITVSQQDADYSDLLTHSENMDLSIRMKLTDHFGLMAIAEISNDGAAQNLTNYADYGFYFLENDARVSPATLMADGTKIAGKAFNDSKTIFMAAYTDMRAAKLDRNLHFMAYAVDKNGNETLGAIRSVDVTDMITDLTDGYVGSAFVTANKQEIELYRSMLQYGHTYADYENIDLNIGALNLAQSNMDKTAIAGTHTYVNTASSNVEKNIQSFAQTMYNLDLDVMGLNECDVYRGSASAYGGYHTPWEIAQRMEDLTGEKYYWAYASALTEAAKDTSNNSVRPFYNRYEAAGETLYNRPDGLYFSGDGKLPSDGYADHAGYGEGLVSKYPIVSVEERHIDVAKYLEAYGTDAEKEYFKNYNADYEYDPATNYERRVILIATLNVEGQLVTVMVSHWDHKSYTFDYVDSNGETQTIKGNEFPRVAAAKACIQAFEDYSDRPTFLMGDLNVGRHSSYIKDLDKVVNRAGDDNMTPTFPSGSKIDHILYNDHAKVVSYEVATRNEASDHHPVHVHVHLSKTEKTVTTPNLLQSSFDLSIQPTSTYPAGDGAEVQIFEGVTEDFLTEYAAKLEAVGFTRYTQTSFNGSQASNKNYFATYVTNENSVDLGYHAKGYLDSVSADSSKLSFGSKFDGGILFATISPRSGLALPAKEAPDYTPVDPTKYPTILTQVGLGDYHQNEASNCYLIRLADGTFIVHDAGYGGNMSPKTTADAIYELLYKQAPDKNHIVISAWITTHPHRDHMDGLEKFANKYASYANVTVKQFVHNFADDSISDQDSNQAAVRNAVKKFGSGVTVVKPHAGNVLYYANVKFNILYTQENFLQLSGSTLYDGNASTVVMQMETDKGVKVLFGGDSPQMDNYNGTKPFTYNAIAKRYGTFLESDILTYFHHGLGGGASWEANAAIKPKIVLWPITQGKIDVTLANSDYNLLSSSHSVYFTCADKQYTNPGGFAEGYLHDTPNYMGVYGWFIADNDLHVVNLDKKNSNGVPTVTTYETHADHPTQ